MLTSSQILRFEAEGFLHLPAVVSLYQCVQIAQIAEQHLVQAIAPLEYEADVGYPGAPASLESEGGRTIRRLRDAYHRDAVFRAWASDVALVAIVRQLLREPVFLTLAHHNCVMTKHPRFGTATGWHRDIRYWSFKRNDLISVWLALGEETQGNGALWFIPGSHRLIVSPEQIDTLHFLRAEVCQNIPLFAQGQLMELSPGDVVFFHSGLFHSAGQNNTSVVKKSVVFSYHGQSNPPISGTRSMQMGSVFLG